MFFISEYFMFFVKQYNSALYSDAIKKDSIVNADPIFNRGYFSLVALHHRG